MRFWARALLVWTRVLGAVSYELFGHLNRAVMDYDGFFDHQVERSVSILIGPPPS